MSQDKAGETRKSFVDSVKGKAKEVAGAVTGNDSLTAEGQLDQKEAKERRQATSAEAEADAAASEAQARAREAELEGAQERNTARARTAGVETTVRAEQDAEKRTAEEAAHQDAARSKAQAEAQAQQAAERARAEERSEMSAANAEYADAKKDYQQEVGEAVRTEAEADRLRQRAESLDDPDLP
jgi:uncharacterized protein YjbJ (UPF0337 family)